MKGGLKMTSYISWIQLTVTAVLIGGVFAGLKNGLKQTQDSIEKYVEREIRRMDDDLKMAHTRIDDANAERRTEYLLESKHTLICSNRMHELKEHVTDSMNAVFDAIRAIDKKIDQLDGRTGFLKDKQL